MNNAGQPLGSEKEQGRGGGAREGGRDVYRAAGTPRGGRACTAAAEHSGLDGREKTEHVQVQSMQQCLSLAVAEIGGENARFASFVNRSAIGSAKFDFVSAMGRRRPAQSN
ncbi:unnamed protein product [Prorocentrum cordatum]|uniref:Uncharacterized protein n=1 Tax=Prorocentrum cordatum TaxID=2364126 RepID=A0ABN9SQM5_9DINO|nr:unnamed protein product [Polarella glacialis]